MLLGRLRAIRANAADDQIVDTVLARAPIIGISVRSASTLLEERVSWGPSRLWAVIFGIEAHVVRSLDWARRVVVV